MPGLGQLSKEAAERKLKEGISGHRTGLPKKLLELFEPRDALEFKPPVRKRPPKVLGILLRKESQSCTACVPAKCSSSSNWFVRATAAGAVLAARPGHSQAAA